jgi:glyoxylase-like metal-dependent hydrolase (beta-lactamase superfamily II)
MLLKNVRFHNGGYCWQNECLTGVSSFKFRRFQAVFISFEHPEHGKCLIDTGYGPDIFPATRRLPWRILRWMTPIPRKQTFNEPSYPEKLGLRPNEINSIFISHFHADHIGGTKLFPDSNFIYRRDALAKLDSMTSWRQLNDGFIPALLPNDFVERGKPLEESQFSADDSLFGFSTLDYWKDGSLTLINLPGHAIGHTGYLLNTDAGQKLYVVDSFWDRRAFDRKAKPFWLARRILHSYEEYRDTNLRLEKLYKSAKLTPFACHCPLTQDQVEGS